MVGELPAAVVVWRTSENREHDLVRRKTDPQAEAEIAIVRRENVAPAVEGHRGAGLQRLVALAAQGEGNFTLPVELKAAVIELPLQQHVAEHGPQLLVGQTVPLFDLRSLIQIHGFAPSA